MFTLGGSSRRKCLSRHKEYRLYQDSVSITWKRNLAIYNDILQHQFIYQSKCVFPLSVSLTKYHKWHSSFIKPKEAILYVIKSLKWEFLPLSHATILLPELPERTFTWDEIKLHAGHLHTANPLGSTLISARIWDSFSEAQMLPAWIRHQWLIYTRR